MTGLVEDACCSPGWTDLPAAARGRGGPRGTGRRGGVGREESRRGHPLLAAGAAGGHPAWSSATRHGSTRWWSTCWPTPVCIRLLVRPWSPWWRPTDASARSACATYGPHLHLLPSVFERLDPGRRLALPETRPRAAPASDSPSLRRSPPPTAVASARRAPQVVRSSRSKPPADSIRTRTRRPLRRPRWPEARPPSAPPLGDLVLPVRPVREP